MYISAFAMVYTEFCYSQDSLKWRANRPDGHAPISVMRDHCHSKGGLMFSYRFMNMNMDGVLNGSAAISDELIFSKYMVSPQTMNMNMHMFGVMYAPTDRLTIMAMGNYLDKSMNLRSKMDMSFSTNSSGFGDLSLFGMIRILNSHRQSLHVNIGASIPTGSLNMRDNTPLMENSLLGYPMQNGSGTIDPRLELVYLGQNDLLSWGVKNEFLARLYDNSENYRLGNNYNLIAWGAIKATDFISFSLGSSYSVISQIKGDNEEYNPMMIPLNASINSGGYKLTVNGGFNIYIPKGAFKNLRLGIEIKYPAIQYVNGYQMNQKLSLIAGIQYGLGHHHH